MARIPAEELNRIKQDVAVQTLVETSGVVLKRAGKDWVGRCPFHEDDTASLVVTPAKNLWHCFGCGIGGGPIDWVMKRQNISFRQAVEQLRTMPAETRQPPVMPVSLDADDQTLLNQVADYYHTCLPHNTEALAYLDKRGFTGAKRDDMMTTFRLGVADRTLGLHLPNKVVKDGAKIRARLNKLGLYRDSGHEHLTGSLIIPVINEAGDVCELYARKIADRQRPDALLHLYLPRQNGRDRGVFNRAGLVGQTEIILCEALIDALTFWYHGHHNVTSSYGIEGFTDEHLHVFRQMGIRRVLIAYDRDEAGERGAVKVKQRLAALGIESVRLLFPKGMDANDYACKIQPADKALGLLIHQAAQNPAEPVSQTPIAAPVTSLAAKTKNDVNPDPPVSAVTVRGDDVTLTLGEGAAARHYRVRGLKKNQSVDVLKVNLLTRKGTSPSSRFHVDTLDLYHARARNQYILQAAAETGIDAQILKGDLGHLLLQLETVQEEAMAEAVTISDQPAMMSAVERNAALALLQSPDLLTRIRDDFARCGLTGETVNTQVAYLAAVSRKLTKPLGVVIQSSSAAGKSTLMDAVLAFIPDEDKVKYSAMTGQSLFYMGETNLKHKVLALAEEEGVSRASYALKLLQSEGELTIASTGKDPTSGNLVTQEYRVEGPVALIVTTTARDIDEELLNRCLVLAVDEGREQTRAIHQQQRDRRTLDGLIASQQKHAVLTLHRNAQRLLRPLAVLNPYARHLTFPDQSTRLRRDHEKYLTLIDTIAFLHQHQRPIHTATPSEQDTFEPFEYLEVTLDDIVLANDLAHDVLGRSLDELPPQTRRLLGLIDAHVTTHAAAQRIARSACHFSRRHLREAVGWGDTQLKIHLARLVEMEYLLVHRNRNNGFEYELTYEINTDDNALRFPGLIDVATLPSDAERSGSNATRSALGRGAVGGQSASGRTANHVPQPRSIAVPGQETAPSRQKRLSGNGRESVAAHP